VRPHVGFAGIAQELRAEQAPDALNPRKDRHNVQRLTPPRARAPGTDSGRRPARWPRFCPPSHSPLAAAAAGRAVQLTGR